MSQLRIAMLIDSLNANGFGVKVVVEKLSRALADAGCDICVFGPADKNWEARDRSVWMGATPKTMPLAGPERFGYAPDLTKAVGSYRPQILHAHGIWGYSAVAAWRLSRNSSTRLVVSPHGMLAPAALRFSPGRKKLARLLFVDRFLASAAMFHATCEAEADEIRSLGLHQPIAIVPNGVDLPPQNKTIPRASRRTVLSLGRLHPVKNLKLLLHAWATLQDRHADWDLKIVGPDEAGYGLELRSLSDKLGLRRVSFEGQKDSTETWRAFAQAGLFVLPSHNENFAITVAEALASAVPVISSQGAPWQGLEQNGCGWWVPAELDAFREAMSAGMSLSDDTRERMGEHGKRWALEDFTWPKIGANLLNCYDWISGLREMPEHVFNG